MGWALKQTINVCSNSVSEIISILLSLRVPLNSFFTGSTGSCDGDHSLDTVAAAPGLDLPRHQNSLCLTGIHEEGKYRPMSGT